MKNLAEWGRLVMAITGAEDWTAALGMLREIGDSNDFSKAYQDRIPDGSTWSNWRTKPPKKPNKQTSGFLISALRYHLHLTQQDDNLVPEMEQMIELLKPASHKPKTGTNVSDYRDGETYTRLELPTDTTLDTIARLSLPHSLVGTYHTLRYSFSIGDQERPIVSEYLQVWRDGDRIAFSHHYYGSNQQAQKFSGTVVRIGLQLLFLGVSNVGNTDRDHYRLGMLVMRDEWEPDAVLSRVRWGLLISDTPNGTDRDPAAARILLMKTSDEKVGDHLPEGTLRNLTEADASALHPDLPPDYIPALISNNVADAPANKRHAQHREDGSFEPDRVLRVSQSVIDSVAKVLASNTEEADRTAD